MSIHFFVEPPLESIDLSASITETPDTIYIAHDFGPGAPDTIPWRANNDQQFPLRKNQLDGIHYGFYKTDPFTGMIGTYRDPQGKRKQFLAATTNYPSAPTVSRTRYLSPDVAPGGGDYSEGNPGNLSSAYASWLDGDKWILGEGTQPYYWGNAVTSKTNLTVVPKPGESPKIYATNQTPPTWTDEGDGVYSTTDFDLDGKQIHALINGRYERVPKTTKERLFPETGALQSATSTSARLAATASAVAQHYEYMELQITSGAAAGQKRICGYPYNTTTKTVLVQAWTTTPSAGNTYSISAVSGWALDGGKVWIKLSSNPATHVPLDPSTTTCLLPAGSIKTGIQFFGDNIWIEGIEFGYFGYDAGNEGRVLVFSSDNVTIKGCIFRASTKQAIYTVGSTNVLIEGNSFIEDQQYKTHEQIKNAQQGSLRTEASTSCSALNANKFTIKNNYFRGGMLAIQVGSTSAAINIFGNTIVEGRSETLDVHINVSQCNVWNNVCQNHHGFALATLLTGPVWYINNLFYDVGYLCPLDAAASPFRYSSIGTKWNSSGNPDVGQFYAINNTIQQDFGGPIVHPYAFCWESGVVHTDTYLRNNIFYGIGYVFHEYTAAVSNYDMDYDLFYSTNTFGYASVFSWRNVDKSSFALWKTASGQEAHGYYANPMLVGHIPSSPVSTAHIPGVTKEFSLTANAGYQS